MLNSMINAQTEFAFKLLQELPQNESIVVSPMSISVSLGMALLGADGNTAKEIHSCIANGESSEKIHEHFSLIFDFINNSINEDAIKMVNKIYFNNDFNLTEAYKIGIKNFYNGNFELINFVDSQKAATDINEFVAIFTKNEIQNIAEPKMFDDETAMVLINAILFEKEWYEPFRLQSSKTEFYSSQNTITQVFMMEGEKYGRYFENEKYQLFEIRYENDLYSMFIILPQKEFELSEILKSKSIKIAEILELISTAQNKNVNVTIPQFNVESSFDLVKTLKKCNINDAFISNKANFSKLSNEKIFISNVVHKACIKISEKGCKAAAATLSIGKKCCGSLTILPPIYFIADRPFLYLIADHHKNINFIGTFYN